MPISRDSQSKRVGSYMDNKNEFCIIEKEYDIIEYEKGLYKSFREKSFSGYRDKNYEIINGDRYRSHIPYEHRNKTK